jgi:hypothetical protein
MEAAFRYDHQEVLRLGRELWDYPVGSVERHELCAALYLAQWWLNNQTRRARGNRLADSWL